MPRARPVNSITRLTPRATPATLTSVRIGRWRMFEVTKLSTGYYHKAFWSKLTTTGTKIDGTADDTEKNPDFFPRHLRLNIMKNRKLSPFVYSFAALVIMLAL